MRSQTVAGAVIATLMVAIACGGSTGLPTPTESATTTRSVTTTSPTPWVSELPLGMGIAPAARACYPGTWELSDEVLIANRTLVDAGRGETLVDLAERDALAAEIADVLAAVREAFPPALDVHVIGVPKVAIFGNVTGELAGRIVRLVKKTADPPDLTTGDQMFDELGTTFGLIGIHATAWEPDVVRVRLCFSDRVNADNAAKRYSAVPDVLSMSVNGVGGTGAVHGLWVTKSNGIWFVAVQQYGPECATTPCEPGKVVFFTVDGAAVTEVPREEAVGDIRFLIPMSRAVLGGSEATVPLPLD